LLTGCLYVTDAIETADPADQVLALLNDDRCFLPFSADDAHGRAPRDVALNKEHIVRVRVDVESAQPGGADGGVVPCVGDDCLEVELSDGSYLLGRLALAAPASASRLVDKLNQTQRFIPIISDNAVDLVHSRHVLCMK